MIFGRRRFAELVGRQLDLFASERRDLLDECADAERAYDRAPREDAEEAYGDYLDAVAAAARELEAIRDTYARGLEGEAREEYDRAFTRAAIRRFPELAVELREPD